MSDSLALDQAIASPHTIYLSDYTVPAFLIDEVQLHFDLNDNETIVTSNMRVRHNRFSKDHSGEFILNGDELTLISITLNASKLEPSQYRLTDNLLIIHEAPDKFDLEIVVKIHPQKNTKLSGLYRSKQTFCTQCEAEGFRRITFYPDHPDILARFTTTIVADKKFRYLLSNGNLIAKGELENGRHWVKWEDPFRKPSYLFALVAGDFDLAEDFFVTLSDREVKLQIYADKGLGDQVDHAMYSLKQAMRWDEKTYGREYDLDIYMIVAIGDFNMGAMENKGLNIFNTKYVLAKPETATDDDYIHILSVIGHEYFHNWSGNRVTCRDWFQLSLKEGLTIFRDQNFTEDELSKTVMRIRDVNYLREVQFPEDAGPLAHPVRPDSYIEINNFYTATVYNKGAEVLRMLRTLLGTKLFRKGMDLYFAQHDGSAVTIEDFIKNMEDVSGINLAQFRLWYSQAGTPVLKISDHYDAQNKTYRLTINQSCAPTPGQSEKYPLLVPIRMALLNQAGHEIPLHLHHQTVETEKVLRLEKASEIFDFSNVSEKPIPSLLRDFSAPVKLEYHYSDDELIFLFEKDTNAFNQFEAGQKYALRLLLNLVDDYQHNKPLVLPQRFIEVFSSVLTNKKIEDKWLISEMLTLPSEKYIGEQMAVIDVDAIHAVREFALHELAVQMKDILLNTYKDNHDQTAYQFNMQALGQRQLKNLCLIYLMRLPQFSELGMQQFTNALKNNMSDTQPALIALSNINTPLRVTALKTFYDTWKHDALVIDKWFAIQAGTRLPIALDEVKKLMHASAFDIKNPNNVYSLIGTFGRNAVNFHVKTGEGYQFLREVVYTLDGLNPQVAARMIKPLTSWKRYDKERQTLMCQQLELLLKTNKLSTDLYELIIKSLER